ncbi:MAG TPA: N-acetylmuramoyl-L-alanine amidase-like domain-containing protein [Terriglobia bacterium]|nr:N-acetylmuramoyl-L-alanine amidase-like domain-containing protein [Terriglobia bacterium]
MSGVAARMESVSGRFLGYPYLAHSLMGSAETPEVFKDSLDGFDCVTYIESVLALVYAGNTKQFATLLRELRYAGGKVEWRRRNHYMVQWLRNNTRQGMIHRVGLRSATNRKKRRLSVVPGLPPLTESFSCIPKRNLPAVRPEIQTGDLIFFASTRSNLDVFHCGILILKGDEIVLRHASRSQGRVVDQALSSFLKGNRMAGVMLARPVEGSRS